MSSETEKDKYLLSISGSISLLDALDEMAPIFVAAAGKDKKKPIGNLENYVCFHEGLRIGVYKHEDKYFIAQIRPPSKKLGVYIDPTFLELSEILTDARDDAYLERAGISGGTFFGFSTSANEKAFLKALTDYDDLMLDEETTDLKEKIKSRKENDGTEDEQSSDMKKDSEELQQDSSKKDLKEENKEPAEAAIETEGTIEEPAEETKNKVIKKNSAKTKRSSSWVFLFILLPPIGVLKAKGFLSFVANIGFWCLGIFFLPLIFLPILHTFFVAKDYSKYMNFRVHLDVLDGIGRYPIRVEFNSFKNFLGYFRDKKDSSFSKAEWFSTPEALRIYEDEYLPFADYCLDVKNTNTSLDLFLENADRERRCGYCDLSYSLNLKEESILQESKAYRHRKKDGSRDKRFKDNPLIIHGVYFTKYSCDQCSSKTVFSAPYQINPSIKNPIEFRELVSNPPKKGKRKGTDRLPHN